MICIPFSYCSREAASPTEAKWLFMILPGWVRDCGSEGRREELGDELDEGSAMMKGWKRETEQLLNVRYRRIRMRRDLESSKQVVIQ